MTLQFERLPSDEKDGNMSRALSMVVAALATGAVLLASPAVASVTPATVTPNIQVNQASERTAPSQDFRSPVIAINPTDANDMVMVGRNDEPDYFCRIYYSFNRGRTWSAATGSSGPRFPDPPLPAGAAADKTSGTCWSPGVAFDAAGNVYVVAQDRPNGGGGPQTIIIWKSTNGGQKFGLPVTIPPSTTSGFSVQADIAIDTSPSSPHLGRIYVTWHEFPANDLVAEVTHSDNGGVTWSPAVNSAVPGDGQTIPDLTVAPDGTVYDIFKTGGAFGGPICSGLGGGSPPPGGTSCPVQIIRSSDGGGNFDAPVTVGTTFFPGGPENTVVDTAVGEEPSLVVTPNGTLLVAVATVPNPPPAGCTASLQAVVYRSTDRGETWSAPRTLNDDACTSGDDHRDPRLSVAPNGRIDAAFYDNRADPVNHVRFGVEYANSTDDGLTFGPNTRLSDATFDGTNLFAVRPPNSPPNGFQTRDYDTVTGLASLDDFVVAAWGDTRNGGPADLFSARILGFLAPVSPVSPAAATPATRVPTAPVTPPGAARDMTRPVVSGLTVFPPRFRIGSLLPRLVHLAKVGTRVSLKVGTRISFSLSEQAAVSLSFARRQTGRLVGGRCRPATPALRHRPACVRYVTVSPSVRFARVRAGANRVQFQGRLSPSSTLRPGHYRLTVRATDPAGNRSKPKRVLLTVLAASRRAPTLGSRPALNGTVGFTG